MKKWELKISKGFNPKTQKVVGLFAAQLDEQLTFLKKAVKDLSVEQLEWQQRPGMNTIGILLAHLVSAEFYWVKIAANEVKWNPDGKESFQKTFGIEDDGIPLAPDAAHTECIKGFTAKQYIDMLDKMRRIRNKELKKWKDKDLDKLYKLGKKTKASRMSTLHHVLEHFCGHFGQVLLLKHMMLDAGILVAEKKDVPAEDSSGEQN